MMPPEWLDDESFAWSVDKTAAVRSLTYLFLTRMGEMAWATELDRGHVHFVPPDAAGVPRGELAAWLARAQADRIARARLFYFEPPASELAIQAGGDLRAGTLPISADLGPPAPYGMMLCPSGLGYSHDGMRLIAINWGPLTGGGWWVTWWADMREYVAWARSELGEGADTWRRVSRNFGVLHHIHSTAMGAVPADDAHEGEFVKVFNIERTQAPEMFGATAALLGAWYLLLGGRLPTERIPPTPEQAQEAHSLGMIPSKITRVYLAGTADPDRLWDYDAGPVS